MHRFFIDKDNIQGEVVILKGDNVKHLKDVLRVKTGDIVMACDGNSTDYKIELTDIKKDFIEGSILSREQSNSESNLEIVLYQGLPKAVKMELIIQKAVELGVTKIVPVISHRTVVKINDKSKEQKKITRWQKISEEAAKQSQRGIIPKIQDILTFDEMMKSFDTRDFILVPYENENKRGLKEALKEYDSGKIGIIIGPEGGFEEDEIATLTQAGAHIVSLGPRILRTETAGFTTISIVMYELGDMGVI